MEEHLTTLLSSRLDTTRDANLWFVVAKGIFLTLSELLTHNIYKCIYKKKLLKFLSTGPRTNGYFSLILSVVHYIYMVDQNNVGFQNTIRFCPIIF